jgi:hypothetical protein
MGRGTRHPGIRVVITPPLESVEAGTQVAVLSTAFEVEGVFSLGEGSSALLAIDEGDNTSVITADPLDFETLTSLIMFVIFTPTVGDAVGPKRYNVPVLNVIEAPVFTVAPEVTGDLDGILTCTTGTLESPDGDEAEFTFQWRNEADDAPLEGETAATLDTQEHIGLSVHCLVTATNSADATAAESNAVGPLIELV